MDGVFSAHVTGNFVLFAVSLAEGVSSEDYLKLATFPVFVLAVMLGTLCYRCGERVLLCAVSGLLLLCGGSALGLSALNGSTDLASVDVLLTLALVLALGAQNALHHFVPGPMSTVMTGTVMHLTAAYTERYILKVEGQVPDQAVISGNCTLWMMLNFALGCALAALATPFIGLGAILLPAVLLSSVLWLQRS
jgi:uncharacterized membrane protein YoaK (UPF0700 family)